MAVTAETLDAAQRMKLAIREMTDDQMLEITAAWAAAWDSLEEDFIEALAELEAADGATLSRRAMARNRKLAAALEQAEQALQQLYELTQEVSTRDLLRVVQSTLEGQRAVMASQLPGTPEGAPGAAFDINSPAPDALNAIILRSTETIHSLTQPLAPWVADKMKQELIRGITLGKNPRAVARRLLRNTEGQFNGGLARALNIARTEMLDAHRHAGRILAQSNTDILAGWLWTATLDARTCPSCLAKHGTLYGVEEFGPQDHQQGRCARVDKVKSWRELGFTGIDEPADQFPSAREWFDNLEPGSQLEIMGPTRLKMLQDGDISWGDLSQRRSTSGWRDSYGVTPVKDLLATSGG